MWTQHKAWLAATYAWEQAAHRPVFNAIMCVTGGLRREHWQPLREAVRTAMTPGPDDDGKED